MKFWRESSPACRAAVVTTAVTLLMVVVLLLMGRVVWCSCGQLLPWSGDVNSEHNSQHLLDHYSLTHLLHGLLFYALITAIRPRSTVQLRYLLTIVIEALWEILENTPMVIERYRAATISLNYYGDSVVNSVADVMCCACGFLLAAKLAPWKSLTVFIAAELLLLIAIRDCLTLNIIMLVYPLDVIREWQMGA
ncbi:MAG: DUF2585 family protein [Planctomycetaceae bacterium]|nr:DUF2585 family protein [Planctomycetaceae bacterium]